jgi:hypothetical protein
MDESATGYISAWIRSIKTSIGVDPGLQSATGVVWRSKRKNRDQDLNSPCLTRKAAQVLGFMAGLGHLDPEPFFVGPQDRVFVRSYGNLTGAKYEKPMKAWPQL